MIARRARPVLAALVATLVLPAVAHATNGRIVFASNRYPAGNLELYSVGADGSSLVRLTFSDTDEQHPTWSPDGSRIAFGSFLEGRQSIHVIDADGRNERRLSPDGYESDDMEPAWSPDGTQIAFASTRPFNGSWHIWVVNADGSGLRQVTGAFSTAPAWSPDGTRIAYLDAGGGISVVPVQGGNAQRVTQPHADTTDERPAWSPDGTKLAFARRHTFGNDPQLYLVDADGSNERQLTTTEGASRFPAWSPDGEWIVFTHIERLSVIRPDGSDMHSVFGEPWGTDLTPHWGTSTVIPEPVVPGAPTIEIYSPEAQAYPAGYPLEAVYRCLSATSFVVSCEGDVPLGAPLDTTTAGPHTFTVRATDLEGRTSTRTVGFEVLASSPPAITIASPQEGAVYLLGETVAASYSCEYATSCVASPVDTSTVGAKTFTVSARDASGNGLVETRHYRVVYPFSELSAPATLKAGERLSVKFSLGGDRGLGVVVGSAWHACGAGESTPAVARLSFQSGRYKLQAETPASWAGSCRRLAFTLDDGTEHSVDVSFG